MGISSAGGPLSQDGDGGMMRGWRGLPRAMLNANMFLSNFNWMTDVLLVLSHVLRIQMLQSNDEAKNGVWRKVRHTHTHTHTHTRTSLPVRQIYPVTQPSPWVSALQTGCLFPTKSDIQIAECCLLESEGTIQKAFSVSLCISISTAQSVQTALGPSATTVRVPAKASFRTTEGPDEIIDHVAWKFAFVLNGLVARLRKEGWEEEEEEDEALWGGVGDSVAGGKKKRRDFRWHPVDIWRAEQSHNSQLPHQQDGCMRMIGKVLWNTRMATAILAQGNSLEFERAASDYCAWSKQ